MLHGKRGIGKTHFALTLATCMSEGAVLWGRYRTKKCRVVYVQADMGPWIQQQRLRRARHLFTLDGIQWLFPDFMNLPEWTRDTPEVKEIRAFEPEFIIWDTLRQIQQLDMNSDETPAWVYGKARSLFPGIAHLFIHHDKKTIADEDKLSPEESFRGSGAWIDNADVGLKVREIVRGKLALDFTKVRTCEEQPSLTLSLDKESLLLYGTGEQLAELREKYKYKHPNASLQQIEHYLLSCFVASPRAVHGSLFPEEMGIDPGVTLGLETQTPPHTLST